MKAIRPALTFDDVLLVPQLTSVRSRKLVDLSTSITPKIALHLPVISANTPWCTEWRMGAALAKLGGIGFLHRMIPPCDQADQVRRTKAEGFSPAGFPHATVDSRGRLQVGAAVGVKNGFLKRSELLLDAGADVLVLDIAHGHAVYALDAIREIKSHFPTAEIVAGNVATARGARDLIEAGADCVKVGIGPGAVCTTRVVTGCGMPQLTAVLDCAEAAAEAGIAVIADGGIRTSGDIVKALAAGASAVMLGTMLAGTEESAARMVEIDGVRRKISTGFVTLGVDLTLKRLAGKTITRQEVDAYVPEGVEATFEYSGPLETFLQQLAGGVRSGFSYCGAPNLRSLWKNAEFVQISAAGKAEGEPHVRSRSAQVHPDYRKLFLNVDGNDALHAGAAIKRRSSGKERRRSARQPKGIEEAAVRSGRMSDRKS